MIKPHLCAFAVLLLPSALPFALLAQQPNRSTVTAELPDAPQATPEVAAALSTSQQQSPAPPAPQQPATDAERHATAEQQLKQEETQRIAGLVPAFNAVIGGKAEPLTVKQKFHLFFRGSIDPYQFVLAGIDAGIEQANDTYPEYHFGIQGYARRYAAAYADNFDGNFWGNAVLPSLFHQDPRYFRLGHGKLLQRVLYSASTTIRAKGDNGKWQPNYSNVLGNLIGGAFSNLYYPKSDRGLGQTFSGALTVTYEGTFGALLLEFYPDISNHFKEAHARKMAQRAVQQETVPIPPASQR